MTTLQDDEHDLPAVIRVTIWSAVVMLEPRSWFQSPIDMSR